MDAQDAIRTARAVLEVAAQHGNGMTPQQVAGLLKLILRAAPPMPKLPARPPRLLPRPPRPRV